MKKTIYTTINERHNGDSFDLAITFDLAEATKAMETDLKHQTPAERAKSSTYIEAREIDVLDGETAKEAYNRLLDADEWPGDCDIVARS